MRVHVSPSFPQLLLNVKDIDVPKRIITLKGILILICHCERKSVMIEGGNVLGISRLV